MSEITLYLGELWHAPTPRLEAHAKGALAVDRQGRIVDHGDAEPVKERHRGATVVDHGDALILPGFVDAHVHFPQLDVIGSHGKQLLDWLDAFTYPAESEFAAAEVAQARAPRFLTELLANGTTLAACYATTHKHAAEALFAAAKAKGLRIVTGKVSMDRAAPQALLQDADQDLADQSDLIAKWHDPKGLVRYALTPRFAVSCSETLLAGLGRLKAQDPTLLVQSHHAETLAEIQEVRRLFPKDKSYLGVYGRFGLLGPTTIMGHGIHTSDDEFALYRSTGTRLAHCPTSNLFLGSGLCPLPRYLELGIPVAFGSDVGGGTSLSLWRTMAAAYEIQQLRGQAPEPDQLFHLATQGGAAVLAQGDVVGSFATGKQADFQVLDWRRSRLLKTRFEEGIDARRRLFALMFLADDRLVRSVVVNGKEVYKN